MHTNIFDIARIGMENMTATGMVTINTRLRRTSSAPKYASQYHRSLSRSVKPMYCLSVMLRLREKSA